MPISRPTPPVRRAPASPWLYPVRGKPVGAPQGATRGERLVRQMLTATPPSASAATPHTRDETLWAEEVARVLEGAATLTPAARQMLRDVLTSMVVDATVGPDCRRDAQSMIEALSRPALVLVAASDSDDRPAGASCHTNGRRSSAAPPPVRSLFRSLANAVA